MRNDIASKITSSIISALESGDIPWIQPWKNTGALQPVNIATGKRYRGINNLILTIAQHKGGYQFSRWLTFKQAKAAGGTVKKNEHGTTVIFWKFLEKNEEEKRIPICRVYTVFNVAQCQNLPEKFTATTPVSPVTGFPEIENFILSTGAKISHGGDIACYRPSTDEIYMPNKCQFVDIASYYATIFHEIIHWTGHETRCNRQLGRFGKEIYAAEELIAEIGSSFLCAIFGIQGKLQHAAYIQTWIKVLRNDKNAIFIASRKAQEAVDFLIPHADDTDRAENDDSAEVGN